MTFASRSTISSSTSSLRIAWDYGRGFDPQLERGIAEALRLIEEYPAATPTPEQLPYRGYPKQ
jgi:hypothetical protein